MVTAQQCHSVTWIMLLYCPLIENSKPKQNSSLFMSIALGSKERKQQGKIISLKKPFSHTIQAPFSWAELAGLLLQVAPSVMCPCRLTLSDHSSIRVAKQKRHCLLKQL